MTPVSPRARLAALITVGCALNVMGFALGGVTHRVAVLLLLNGLGGLLLLLSVWLGLRPART
ncbi:hypothetical protein [Deinococcus radiotolerans]|uniref:Uncharacterized protein n=1 Tax=Deinococcus radiotolerans TaxID=1309407 RepID=A0ABQ2FIZ8_9DEIO|nr:hypothetical protein [Deinococcus radiotolerans]GGL01347.1 hypothetical protein GCM10010844_19730 [Deinococcus radiotolerans]